jgi:DNA-binding transcriptional LysR family regulator
MLDLRRLRLLRELEQRGTVRAVARALDYTPSAVSQQLAVLEREVGVALLERVGRGVLLTEAGRALAARAGDLLERAEAAEAELASLAGGAVSGTVRVAAFQTAALRIVTPALAAVAAAHPRVRVEVTEAELEDAVPRLRLGHLDAVIGDEYDGLPRRRPAELAREPLMREEVRLALPAGHPLANRRRVPLARLAHAPWAAAQPGTGHREMHVRTCRALGGFEPDLRHSSDDLLILLELVRAGGACALLPDLVEAEGDPGVAVRSIAEGRVGREVFLLTRRTRPAALEVFVEALRAASPAAAAAR